MHGVRSGRSLEEVLNAPEKFHIGVVLLEPGLEFTVAVQSMEIDLFEMPVSARAASRTKALATVDGEFRPATDLAFQ
jgi:hypothetical protein